MSIPLFDMLYAFLCVCVCVARVTVKCLAFPPSVVDWCYRNHLYHYHYDRTMRERERAGVRGGMGGGGGAWGQFTKKILKVWLTAKYARIIGKAKHSSQFGNPLPSLPPTLSPGSRTTHYLLLPGKQAFGTSGSPVTAKSQPSTRDSPAASPANNNH